MKWGRILRWTLLAAAIGLAAAAYGCANMVVPAISNDVSGPEPGPAALGAFGEDPPVTSAAQWRERRAPMLREAFAREVYGGYPPPVTPEVVARRVVAEAAFGGRGRVEELDVAVGPGGAWGQFRIGLALPARAAGPAPVVIMQTFCGNRAAFNRLEGMQASPGAPPEMCEGGFTSPLIHFIFGRYIDGPPFEKLLERGYAAAVFYAGDVVPDAAPAAAQALVKFAPDADENARPAAIGAWAWLYSQARMALAHDPRLDPGRAVAWGHSRNGKSALLAAAHDPAFAAVIAHQSGTGGGSLSRKAVGETIAEITRAYPHWFNARYASYAGREQELPLDQHLLLALIAPRPVLLGNARRDQWSDPAGAYRAAMAADEVYELLGARGLDQKGMTDYRPDAEIAFFLRSGTHGVTTQDWKLFLQFLDAHVTPRAGG